MHRETKMATISFGLSAVLATITSNFAHTKLDSSKVLDFSIAETGSTRIALEGGTIADVFVLHSDPQNVAVVKSGYVFINPEYLDTPLYMTLLTSRGTAQDLRLVPRSKKAEPILLKAESYEVKESANMRDEGATILTQFMGGIVPQGFMRIQAQEVSRAAGECEALIAHAYQNPTYRVLIFTITNKGTEKSMLDNQAFWAKSDLALAFDKGSIDSGETAILYVLQQR